MPCRYYTEQEERDMANQALSELKSTNTRLVQELNETTRLLCGVMETLGIRAQILVVKEVEGLETWCRNHNLRDKRREKAEKQGRLEELRTEMNRIREQYRKIESELNKLDEELPEE
jgi:hypothetical protein